VRDRAESCASLSESCDRSIQAANEALGALQKTGIVRVAGEVRRNRAFEATEILDLVAVLRGPRPTTCSRSPVLADRRAVSRSGSHLRECSSDAPFVERDAIRGELARKRGRGGPQGLALAVQDALPDLTCGLTENENAQSGSIQDGPIARPRSRQRGLGVMKQVEVARPARATYELDEGSAARDVALARALPLVR
jgi:hypothetical protein